MKRIVLTALALVPLAFPSSAATQKASDVEVYDSTQRYKIEPKRVDLDGMPGPWYFSKLQWRSWGAFKAKSSMARLKVQDCKPSCAEGGLKTIKAKLKLSHPATCHGHRVFSKAVIDPKRGGFAPVGTDIEPEPTLPLVISCEGFVAPWGSRTKTAPKGFDQCGDRPEQFFFGIRAEGVSCSKARKVAGKWYANGVDQGFPRVVKFKQWRCVSKSYGDGVNVKCKRGNSDEVRFAAGG